MLHRWLLVGFVIMGAAAFSACTTIPPKEVHAAAGILRTTIVDATARDEVPTRFAVGGSVSRGSGSQDTGKPADSTNLSADVELRVVNRLAFGLQPYLSVVDGEVDSRSHFGAAFYARWRFLDAGRWAFSVVPGIGYGRNTAEDQGTTCGLFGCVSSGDVSQARVEIIDPRLGFIVSHYFDDRNLLSLIPTVSYTRSSGSSAVSNVTRFSGARSAVEWSAELAYGYVMDIGEHSAMFQVAAGAASHWGFGPFDSGRHLTPLVQIGMRFSLGPGVE